MIFCGRRSACASAGLSPDPPRDCVESADSVIVTLDAQPPILSSSRDSGATGVGIPVQRCSGLDETVHDSDTALGRGDLRWSARGSYLRRERQCLVPARAIQTMM
jgi:hypothetical protein